MAFLLLLCFITLSFVYPGEVFPALAPYRFTYYVGMIGLAASVFSLVKKAEPLKTVQWWFLVAFTVTISVSRMIADQWLGAPAMVIERFGPSLAMFILAVCGISSLKKLRTAAFVIVLLSLMLTLQGAAAYHFGYQAKKFLLDPVTKAQYVAPSSPDDSQDASYDANAESGLSEDDEGSLVARIRGLGAFADPNDLALALVLAVALLGGVWMPKATIRNALVVGLPAAALSYGVFLTHSRGGMLALIVTLWRAATLRSGRIQALLVLVVLAGSAAAIDFGGGRHLFSASDESASGRLEAWTEGIEMLKAQPIVGVGFQQFRDYHTLTAHNSFVLCFAESGIVGYFFWLGLIVITYLQLREFRKLDDREPLDRDLKHWGVTLEIALLGFLTGAFFLSRTYVTTMYLIVGLSVALVLIAKDAKRPVWSRSVPIAAAMVLAVEAGSILLIYGLVKLHLG